MTTNSCQIILDGNSYTLHPTFAALSGIEQTLGIGFVALARKLAEGDITLEELAAIISGCMAETPPDKDALVRGGLANVIETVSDMFAAVFGESGEAPITRRNLEEMMDRFSDVTASADYRKAP